MRRFGQTSGNSSARRLESDKKVEFNTPCKSDGLERCRRHCVASPDDVFMDQNPAIGVGRCLEKN